MLNTQLEQSYLPFQCMIINNANRFNIEGVSTAQYYILDILDKEQSKTTKELAQMRGISQSGISKLTKRLLDKRYIIQERNQIDRRFYNIKITNTGKEFLLRSEKFRNKISTCIQSALTDSELETFIALCQKIVTNYDNNNI